MDYLTELPSTQYIVGADFVTLQVPPTMVLNDLNPSNPIDTYKVKDDASGPDVLVNGDYVAPVVNGVPIPGEYIGSATVQNASINIGSMQDNGAGGLLALGLSVSINPIDGDLFRDEAGKVYFISEQPLSAERLMATIRINLPGNNNMITLTVPISELSATVQTILPGPAFQALLGRVGDLSQYMLDSSIMTVSFDPGGIKQLPVFDLVCFCAGTNIMTPSDYVPVEKIRVGDLVLSYGGQFRKIRWTGSRKIAADLLGRFRNMRPVRIETGALGAGIPDRDLFVSQQHRILLASDMTQKLFQESAVLVAAIRLVGLPGIAIDDSQKEIEYFHLLLDEHEVLLANGAWSESLFTGPMALRSLTYAAQQEIVLLFPELKSPDHLPQPALPFVSGKESKRLVERHARKRLSLCNLPPPTLRAEAYEIVDQAC